MTRLITWSDALSVGVQRFDDQHQGLVAMVNDLHDAMAEGHGAAVLGPILDRLFEYTRIHFAEEEAVLALHGYPGLTHQVEEHQRLADRVRDFQRDYRAGKVLISVELMTFLREWLVNHIQHEDGRYGPFLNARGIR